MLYLKPLAWCDRYVSRNPYGVPQNVETGWASRVGQDFSAQHANADFAEFHLW